MKACLDTDYRDPRAQCAGVLFREWDHPSPAKVYRMLIDEVEPYEPGSFYKRELPCLLQTLEQVTEDLEVIVIDGYVWLGEGRGGLGWHLHEALDRTVPVIGVAKNYFRGADRAALPLQRGKSAKPLWITAIGLEPADAVHCIRSMHGPYRTPTLLKIADAACREKGTP